jgi:putative CocE/NonD family hydrolase
VKPDVLPVADPVTRSRQTRDGLRLDASVWRPVGPGSWPVLLMRQAYGRAIASSVVLAHPSWYAAHGYIVMVEDVRGTGTSEGRFSFLGDDLEDGPGALDVAANLDGSTGKVGLYGFSYQGINPFLTLAGARNSGSTLPGAIVTSMASWNVRDHLIWEGGAIRLQLMNLALQYAVTQAERAGDVAAFTALRAAAQAMPLSEEYSTQPSVLARFGHYAPWADWLIDDPSYWAERSPCNQLSEIGVATLVIGGQMDALVDGSSACWAQLSREPATPSRLILGPWGHIPWGRRAGSDLGQAAAYDCDAASVRWFDQHLKGLPQAQEPRIEAFDLGARSWRSLPDMPGKPTKIWFLSSDGLAGTRSDRGALAPEPTPAQADVIVHDPWRPVPALGGHLAGGMIERGHLDERTDVAVYTSEPFDGATTIAGPPHIVLQAQSDAASFDLAVTLSLVSPDGSSVLSLSTGFCRVRPDAAGPYAIALRPLCVTPARGMRLRVSIAGAAWPAFTVNPGTGAPDSSHRLIDARPITLKIQCDGVSRITLPVSA